MTDDSTAGQFLVATPLVGGVPFDRSVVLILEHDGDGAIGVIINLVTDIEVVEHLPDLGSAVSAPGQIHIGGPVDNDTALLLGRSITAEFLRPAALGDIGLMDPDGIPDDTSALRVFAGYAGWEPGQLEQEMLHNTWLNVPANPDIIFDVPFTERWSVAAEIIGVDISQISPHAGHA